MTTKKFWCHYIGSDGNTPKRRNIELKNLASLVPAIGDNEHCETPLWYDKTTDEYNHNYYHFYAQLSDNVAVLIIQAGLSDFTLERITKTDEQIDAYWQQWKQREWEDHPKNDIGKAKDEEFASQRAAEDREERDRIIGGICQLKDYANYLLDGGSWVSAAALRAFQEVGSGYYPLLEIQRKEMLAERERKNQERREKDRQRAEEEARKKAEAEAKEQERLTQEAEKFKQGESVAGEDVVTLCRRYGIAIHLRTVHNLQQVIATINGKGSCQYYRSRGKRRPVLDGCYKTARELYDYLQNNPSN